MTLTVRFSLSLIAFSFSVLLLFAVSYYTVERRATIQTQQDEQANSAQKLASVCQWIRLAASPVIAVNYVQVLKREPTVAYAVCLDSHGKVQAHSDPQWIGKPWDDAADLNMLAADSPQKKNFPSLTKWYVPVTVGASKVGLALLAYDAKLLKEDTRRRLIAVSRQLLLVAGGTFLLAIAVSFLLAGSLSRPIRSLAMASRVIGSGRLDYQTPLAARKDELGILAQEMNTMTQHLKKLDDFKDEFVAAVSHDLRNPLAAMQMYAEVLRSGRFGETSDAQNNALEMILDGARRLHTMINNVLDAAKIKTGRLEIDRKPIDLAPIIEEIVSLFRISAQFKELELKCEMPSRLPTVSADAEGISRVLSNLISNAIKFTPPKGRVVLKISENGSWLSFRVEDTGSGIAAENMSKLFQPFERLGQNGKVQGTGLGLVITKKIVEAHGGTITVESQKSRGTSFNFTLPKAERHA